MRHAVLAIVMMASVCVGAAATDWILQSRDGRGAPQVSQLPGEAMNLPSSLDEVPGFGYSLESMARDDLIAVFETFKREEIRMECMTSKGQPYQVRLDFPDKILRSIASTLKIQEGDVGGTEISSAKWVSGLEKGVRDDYLEALYGITSKEYFAGGREAYEGDGEATTIDPLSDDRGCYGTAWTAVPGVWSLRDRMAEDVLEMRHSARKIVEGSEASIEFNKCASKWGLDIQSPIEIEAQRLELDVQAEVLNTCAVAYDRAYESILGELERELILNSSELQEQVTIYEGMTTIAGADMEFRAAVGRALKGYAE